MNLLSACRCTAGYSGFGCTDSTYALSRARLLTSVLTLTLSNLIFIMPIALAIYRKLYAEAFIYAYNMFFSTVCMCLFKLEFNRGLLLNIRLYIGD
jgi:transmembrane protein 8A/B